MRLQLWIPIICREFLRDCPFCCFCPMQTAILFLTGQAKCAMFSVIAQTIVNIVSALVNVFHLQGGMLGMGMVMLLCYVTSLLVMLLGIRRSKNIARFLWHVWKWRQLLQVLRIGFPSVVDRFFKTIQIFFINRILPIASSISTATLTMIGVFSGERYKDSLQSILKISLIESSPLTLLTAITTCLVAPFLVVVFIVGVNALNMTYLSSAWENLSNLRKKTSTSVSMK